MNWKRAVLSLLLITVLTAVFEITFRVLFKPEVVTALRNRLFSAQQVGWLNSLTWLSFLASLAGGEVLLLRFRQGTRSRVEYIVWLGLMGSMCISVLILLLTYK
jgi:hypothetical protein